MATMQANLNAADRETLNKLSSLETSMNSALDLQRQDYENRINSLNQTLTAEASALRTEMANLSNAYQTEISYLKENLEQQISNLKETTQKTTDDLQKQIVKLETELDGRKR